jgi:hypothetical protein
MKFDFIIIYTTLFVLCQTIYSTLRFSLERVAAQACSNGFKVRYKFGGMLRSRSPDFRPSCFRGSAATYAVNIPYLAER